MIEAHESAPPAEGRLPRARAEFVATLGRRLNALRSTLQLLEESPASRERRDMLLRRVHALASAARVLGFDAVAEALGDAEQALARSAGGGPVLARDLAEVSRALDVLPSVAWGAKPPSKVGGEVPTETAVVALGWPIGILVFGPATLREAIAGESDELVECHVAETVEEFRELAQRLGPDVAVIDADRRGARELLELVTQDPLIEPFPSIVVGTFDQPEAASAFVAQGATRVLPKPVGPEALRRAVAETSRHEPAARGAREPIGDVTVDELAARIAAEVRRGLVESLEPGVQTSSIPLGEGTDVLAAVWGAVARVRELLTMRSGGAVRFHAGGPEGAVPMAPWTATERRAGERGSSARRTDGVRLEGRRAVVVDDDPAVVWFLSGLLRTSGVEVAEAHDGNRARALVFDGFPDLVVTDVLMPGIDGFSLCREIKRDVAVRDVPVILLSWKEDLLQRVRELGAGADGYLRKEAAASTVLQRVREVLRPRARVESRLAGGGEVRGRLDGLTPRLLLQLAQRHQPSCRVSVRDAVYLYELEMREGRPRSVTRTAADGSFERGPGVLDAVLGVAAGRFVVAPASGACRDDLGGELDELILPRVRRARAALAALEDPSAVDRIEIAASAIEGYLSVTPEPARGVLEALIAGRAPRELLAAGRATKPLLEQLLADVAARGAVRGVVRGGVQVDLARTAEPPPVVSPEEPPLFTLQLSPAPPDVGEAVARWEQPDELQRELVFPLSRSVTPPVVRAEEESAGAVSSAAFRDEPRTAPGVGPPLVVSRPQPLAAPVAVPTLDQASPEPPAPEPEVSEPSPGFEPDRRPIELPAGAFPAAEGALTEPHDVTPSTLRAEPEAESPPAPSTQDAEPEATMQSEPEERPSVRAAKKPVPTKLDATLPSRKIEFPGSRKPGASARPAVELVARKLPPARGAAESADRPLGMGRIALMTILAAGLSFGAVTLIRRATGPTEPVAAPAADPIASAVPAAAVRPATQALEATVEDLALPPGVPLAGDKGLLEVDIGGKHPISVDGTFVGRGPLRRVPLAPGPHQVTLKLPEAERVVAVDVKAGRRARVALPPAP